MTQIIAMVAATIETLLGQIEHADHTPRRTVLDLALHHGRNAQHDDLQGVPVQVAVGKVAQLGGLSREEGIVAVGVWDIDLSTRQDGGYWRWTGTHWRFGGPGSTAR